MTTSLDLIQIAEAQLNKFATANTQSNRLDEAITDEASYDFVSGNITLTDAQLRATFTFLCINVSVARTLDLDVPTTAIKRFILVTSAAANTANVTVNRGTTNIDVTPDTSKLFYVDGTANGLRDITGAAGGVDFLGLTDVDPSSYSGQAGKLVRVNSTPDGLEFVAPGAAGTGGPGGAFGGLIMGSPSQGDETEADTKIQMRSLKWGVFDDGFSIQDVGFLELDVTGTGIGGLDTGSLGASEWWEIYLAQRSDTEAVGLVASLASDLLATEQQGISDNANVILNGSTTVSDRVAQSFLNSATDDLMYVDLKLNRLGNPTANSKIWITIEADSSGDPSGTPLATSIRLTAPWFSTSDRIIRFTFPNPAELTASTTYWIVVHADYTQSDTSNVRLRGNTTSTYASGLAKDWDGATTWTSPTDGSAVDLYFRTFMRNGGGIANITVPTNYDRFLKIGYFFSDGNSDIMSFIARDKRVDYMKTQSVTLGSTIEDARIQDLKSMLPPTPVLGHFSINDAQTDANRGNHLLGGLPYGHAGSSLTIPQNHVIGVGKTTGQNYSYPVPGLLTEGQAVFWEVDIGTSTNSSLYTRGFEWFD